MQTDLFIKKTVPIQEVADELNVSLASIRNWVASGDLELASQGLISKKSFEHFKSNVVGKTRLTMRANKLFADNVDVEGLQLQIISDIDTQVADLENVSDLYEASLGKSYRNQEGVYYTPDYVIDRMFNAITGDVSNLTFLDPCCGSGNFLLGALRRGFRVENIFGSDCDKAALKIAKARMEAKIKSGFENLTCLDFLVASSNNVMIFDKKYDVIFTNPPWGKKYQKSKKLRFANSISRGTVMDSSALVALAAIKHSRPGAIIGMLMPDSFCNITVYKGFREAILDNTITVIEDHKKPFKGLMTGAVSIVFEVKEPEHDHQVVCVKDGFSHTRKQESFKRNPNHILNYDVTQETTELIEYLFDIDHITLKDHTKWGLGIVTGNNKKFCEPIKNDKNEPVYSGSDILAIDNLKEASKFLKPNFDKFQQVAPEHLYRSSEKLIYKFISNQLCFFYDEGQRLILNSANMLITEDEFPVKMQDVAFLLNTNLMNFIFKSIFRTHKVLRSDLQCLPIFYRFFNDRNRRNEKSLLDYLNIEEDHGTYRIKN